MSASYPSYRYSAVLSDTDQFLNKITLDRPLLSADGTDSLLGMPPPAPDDDLAVRRKPIYVVGTLLIDVNAQGYNGPTAFDIPAPLLALAKFLNDCVRSLEPPTWEGVWPPTYVETLIALRPQDNGKQAVKVVYTVNPRYEPVPGFDLSGFHFARHMFMEQGHRCRRFAKKQFFLATPYAPHIQGIIRPCMASKPKLG